MDYHKHDKFTSKDLGQKDVVKGFAHLQNEAGLQEHGKERVNEGIKAVVTRMTEKHGLSGMYPGHIDEGLNYLFSPEYKGYSKFTPKEREVIEKSLHAHFHGSPELPKPEAANDDRFEKAA